MTCTGPLIPNLSPMWPAKPNELPNLALKGGGSQQCNQMTHWGGRGKTKVSRDIFGDFLNYSPQKALKRLCFLCKSVKYRVTPLENIRISLNVGWRGSKISQKIVTDYLNVPFCIVLRFQTLV